MDSKKRKSGEKSQSSDGKKSRNRYSLKDKLEIIELHEKGASFTNISTWRKYFFQTECLQQKLNTSSRFHRPFPNFHQFQLLSFDRSKCSLSSSELRLDTWQILNYIASLNVRMLSKEPECQNGPKRTEPESRYRGLIRASN